jgi:hypothetical protein
MLWLQEKLSQKSLFDWLSIVAEVANHSIQTGKLENGKSTNVHDSHLVAAIQEKIDKDREQSLDK